MPRNPWPTKPLPRNPWTISILTALVCLAVFSGESRATWPADGAPVCVRAEDQRNPQIISDGTGGMIVAWADRRDDGVNYYAYVQRLDGSGLPVWSPADGFTIDGGGHPNTNVIDVVSDGGNGAIVVWTTDGIDLWAQRVNANGAIQWAVGGVNFVGNAVANLTAVTADGAGGMIVAWPEASGGGDMLYVQKIRANGTEAWSAGGLPVFSIAGGTSDLCIIADGSGGALFSTTIAPGIDSYILVQRIYASGTLWSSSVSPGLGLGSALATNGAGGAYVAWQWRFVASIAEKIQLINGQGVEQWVSPVRLSQFPPLQVPLVIVDDASGNAVVCWQEDRFNTGELFAQKIDVFGTTLWTADGARLSIDGAGEPMRILRGSGSNVIVAAVNPDTLKAQAIDVGGGPVWKTNGIPMLSTLVADFDVTTDGAGGILATLWTDRSGLMGDIYAQAVNSLGNVYAAEPAIEFVTDVPNDQGGWVRLRIRRSDRDDLAVIEEPAARYDVWREVPAPALAPDAGAVAAYGGTLFEIDGKQYLDAPQGVVFPAGVWELLGGFGATQSDKYTYAAPTFADSTTGNKNDVGFVVSVNTTNPAVWFVGAVVYGHSVDNIPPGVPTGMAVAYNAGGGNQLTWDRSSDDDFKYFRIYRSTDPGFTPSPATYVHGSIDTQWLDPVADGWMYTYKMSAVDMADNESDPTGGTATGVRDGAAPARVTLGQNVPNPFNPSTAISMGLPAAGHVTLTVYDIGGRRVRTLVDAPVPAGFRSVTWDGRDSRGQMVASGVYFYRMTTEGYRQTRKMLLVK